MNAVNLPSLPLPLISALLAVVVRRLDPGTRRMPQLLSAMFLVITFESLLVALRFAYGIGDLVLIQAILPLLVGPLLYLGFTALAVTEAQLRRLAALHFGAVALLLLATQLLPRRFVPLDWAISASYLTYAALLFRLWRRGPDALIQARLDMVSGILRWMLGGVGLMLLLLLIDSAIAISFATARAGQATALITYGSAVLIGLMMMLLIALPRMLERRPAAPITPPEPQEDLTGLEEQARTLLLETQLYLDPALSVQRLARRLRVPERRLSRAINESRGVNVSQYVNGFRLEHAARLLRSTDDSVAEIMTRAGFLTRSNFYREFQRVYGQSPASYRQQGPKVSN